METRVDLSVLCVASVGDTNDTKNRAEFGKINV